MHVKSLVVDTNVLLDGGLDPESHAGQLLRYPHTSRFLVCRWALDEAAKVIAEAPVSDMAKSVGIELVERFAYGLSPLVVDDGGTHMPRSKDAMVKRALTLLAGDFVLTRNVKDFPGLNTLTPSELLRQADFRSWSIDAPWAGFVDSGTVAIRCRCWPGASYGWLMRTRDGAMVGLNPEDGSMRLTGETRGWKVTPGDGVPHEHDVTIVGRVRQGRTLDITYVDHDAENKPINVGSVTTNQPASWRPALMYGANYGWNAEVAWMGCTPRRLSDKQLAIMVSHQTTDSGVDVAKALQSLVIVPSE